ncbi:two-component response regulator ARR14-like [Sesamum indicum]|uniref:Two-component response regulator ARR14-like n=1 Tax=Sesamum indicum TaxID=4182 RepID=A0A6I9SY30_SESIN|nr:two-component response regulator ARR14-like [Sesamum indicum]
MWDLGNLSAPTASYLTVMHEIHVLLVDHDSEGLMNIGNQLEACHYRVTLVELASSAITMLLNGKVKFDLVMANINSPDLHGFKLLQQAVNMDIPVVLMSVDDNVFIAMRAIENGAFLFIKKPTSMEVLSGLWQHVIREKTRAMRERERSCVAANYNVRGIEFREVVHEDPEENPNHMYGVMMNDKGKGKKKINIRGNYDEYDLENHIMMNNKVKRKVCTEWTQELHEKFMEAVEQLGEGRCFPKEILELMNVPGLTRMQVASHLQKCRNDNWRSPGERKTHNLAIQPLSSDTDGSQRPRRFGSMPRLSRASSYRVPGHEGSGVGESSKTNSPTEMPNSGGVVDQNMEISGPIMPNASYHQHYGTLIPHPSTLPGTIPSNPMHQSDDFFNFADMDRLIQNFSGFPQGPLAGMNNPGSSSGGYHFDATYHHGYDQNNVRPSADTAGSGQWSSGTSNFGSDEYSETRGHN